MTATERIDPAGGHDGSPDAPASASGPHAAAPLLERLAAVEAAIRDECHRQPASAIEEIARAWTAGATITETAARAGVSRHIVRDRLHRVGALEYPSGRRSPQKVFEQRGTELIAAYEAGTPLTVLAADAGVCFRTLGSFLVARGVRLRHDRGWYRRRRDAGG